METPILPNKRDDEDKRDERPLQLRYLPRPEVLRIIAGTLAIVGALIGLISRLDAPAAGPSFSPGPLQSAPTAIYGQPDRRESASASTRFARCRHAARGDAACGSHSTPT